MAPDDRAAVAREMDAGTQSEAAGAQTELRFLCRNGSSTWVLLSTSLLRDDDAGFHHHRIVQAIGIDAQKKAEAALAESLDRWNFALEGGHQGVWDRGCQADTNFLSPMWRIIRGMEPDEEIDPSQSAWLERLHPDDLPHILQTISNNNSGNTGFSEMRYRERHRDGNYISILSRGKTIAWLPDGRPARMIGTDTDITRQETLRAALAAETERLDITLNAISDGVISTDCDGRVTMMNPAAEKMTGWRSEDADGQRIEYVFNLIAESGGRLLTPVDACLDTRRPCRLDEDAVLVARDGERRGIQAAASPVQTPQGVVLGSVLVFQDVTARRALQRELAYAAKHDCLTGLPNRVAFEEALGDAAAQAKREMREHALCFIDIDRFKTVNDQAGHAAGDTLLKQIARLMSAVSATGASVARVGGDEFALLLPDCSTAQAATIASALVADIAAIRFVRAGTVHTIGASVGITPITSRSTSLASLLDQADAACYRAKANGRNQVVVDSDPTPRPALTAATA